MKYYQMIKQNFRFQRLFKKGETAVSPLFVCYVRRKPAGKLGLGIAVSKKIGKAHTRNRAKRVLREAAQKAVACGLCPCDMVLVARSKTPFVKSDEVSTALISALFAKGYIEAEK